MSRDVFTLGVASGDPMPTAVVLWTRLAPEPLSRRRACRAEDVPVQWQVAARRAVHRGGAHGHRDGPARATPTRSTSTSAAWSPAAVLVPLPHRRGADRRSPVGRTRTSPPCGRTPSRLAFAFASCQQFEHGYFTAYGHMAEEDLDLVSTSATTSTRRPGRDVAPQGNVPAPSAAEEIRTLDDYRERHAQYRSDPDLQAAHAACPWVVAWDDHEVENN